MKGLRIQSLIPALLVTFVVTQMMVESTARADDEKGTGWFFEFGVGSARDRNEVVSGIGVDKTNYVQRGYLGYRFWNYFGIEGGFLNFNTIKYVNNMAGTTDTFDFDGYHGKLFVNLPFHRDNEGFYALYLSGGSWHWDGLVRSPNGGSHTHGTNPTASVGLLFSGRTSALKLEYERFLVNPSVPVGDFVNDKNKLKYDVVTFNFLFYL
jgi:hypothetical protein